MKTPKVYAWLLAMACALCALAVPAHADEVISPSVTQAANGAAKIAASRDSLRTLQSAAQSGHISQQAADAASVPYYDAASQAAGRVMTRDEILAAPDAQPDLSTLQRWVGAMEGARWGIILGTIFGVIFGMILFSSYIPDIVKFFKEWPAEVYEVLLYALSLGLLVFGVKLAPHVAPYVGFGGSVLFAGALSYSVHAHKWDGKGTGFLAILAVVWGAAALWYGSSLLGFIAVGALIAALGISEMLSPVGYILGYPDDSTVGSATGCSFVILALFVVLRWFGVAPGALGPFEYGGLWLGSFGTYLGLLIMSSRWYDRRYDYVQMQLITVAAGVLAMVVGSWLGIPELLRIGGTFFAAYVLAKIIDIPVDGKRGAAWIGLTCSVLLIIGGWYAKTHVEQMQPFLLAV